MDTREFDEELFLLLGVRGPMCPVRDQDGNYWLVYKIPNGDVRFEPPTTSEQRAEIISKLKILLGDRRLQGRASKVPQSKKSKR